MKHLLNLKTQCNNESETEQLIKLFIPEDKKLSNGRAEYFVKQEGNNVIFEVQAQDAVALRATITSITKTLDIYERTTKIIQGE